jgi:hypothetical protein
MTAGASTDDRRFEAFQVEPWLDCVGGVATRWPGLWQRLGNFEKQRFSHLLDGIEIEAPIFICGLARAGTSILLECLAAHPDTATHRYRDYPGVLAPIFWDQVSARLYRDRQSFRERAHGDGISVSPDSPEAMEEMLWMSFYPHVHDPGRDNCIYGGDLTPDFAAFYRDHIRKILWLRDGRRYLAKGNYNVSRLGGLIELFPDARIIIPVRDPVTHLASLVRQHRLFAEAEARYPAALRYMQRVGHFEFGLDRRPLNLGDAEVTADVQRLWREGHDIDGWSLYWSYVCGFIADMRKQNPALAEAVLVVRYEDLCADPLNTLARIFAHVRLVPENSLLAKPSDGIRTPAYYDLPFNKDEQAKIRSLTAATAQRFGYPAEVF